MNDRTAIAAFLAGGVTGAALTLLLAPQSGSTTRERIRRTLRDTADAARNATERLAKRGEEIREDAANRIQDAGSVLGPRMTGSNGDAVILT